MMTLSCLGLGPNGVGVSSDCTLINSILLIRITKIPQNL